METDRTIYLRMLPKRRADSNKGTYGKILIAAGTEGMCGAAVLAGLAAYRSGGGLVKILTHRENRIIVQSLLPEAVFSGFDAHTDFAALSEANASWADILVLGPGLGTGAESTALVRQLLRSLREKARPERFPMLLIDADGLNILSMHPELLQELKDLAECIPTVVTPHPMEMSRLLGRPLPEILASPQQAAADFAEEHGCITLLKGPETVVLDPAGYAFQNTVPSPALSKGGAGDVLSGTIAGVYAVLRADRLMALGELPPDARTAAHRKMLFDSTVLGMLVHAEAGRRAAVMHGTHGVLMREVADLLGQVMEA